MEIERNSLFIERPDYVLKGALLTPAARDFRRSSAGTIGLEKSGFLKTDST